MTISKNLGLLAPQVSSSGNISYADLTNKPSLSTVATSGSYADLSNQPVVISLKGSTVTYPGDDLAADTAGAQTIIITGTGFESTPTVYIGGTIAPSVTFVSSTQITFTTPAKTAGTYDIYIVNPGGATAIMVMGISYSGTPSWTTAAGSLGSVDANFTIQLQAAGDAPVTYALTSGSTLPSGVTLNSSGLITGTAIGTDQTFNFSVTATDVQNQDTPRSFSVTVTLNDVYFKYTTLLLSGDPTPMPFTADASANNLNISISGNVRPSNLTPFTPPSGTTTYGSAYFDGSGDSLSIPNNANLTFGSGDFTIEAWVYADALGSYNAILAQWPDNGGTANNSYVLEAVGSDMLFYWVSGTTLYGPATLGTITTGSWIHYSICRSGNTLYPFKNGVLATTVSITQTLNSPTSNVTIGGAVAGAGSWNGYISNVRVVKGTALYTSTFTPSTTPLTAITNTSLLTLQNNGSNDNNLFKDDSANNLTITRNGNTTQGSFSPYGSNWSNYFGGVSRIYTPHNSTFEFGTGDFTMECWINMAAGTPLLAYWASFLSVGADGTSDGNGVTLYVTDGNSGSSVAGEVAVNIGAATRFYSGQDIRGLGWVHVALTRQGSTNRLFLNGVLKSTITNSLNINATNYGASIALSSASQNNYFVGYVSNARVVKGTAVYTSNFTPSTTPLTVISGTSLLTCADNRFIDEANNIFITTVGTPSVQRFNPFGAGSAYSSTVIGGSAYFDGTGDYLNTASNAAFTLGSTGNFTVECWVYLNGSQSSSFAAVMTNMANFSNGYAGRWALTINGLNLRWYNSAGEAPVDSTPLIPYQWTHIAAVRNGSIISVYVNGVEVGAQTQAQAYTTEGSLKIGFLTSAAAFRGYITDARVVKGTAVYTANFTPPTAPLTAITNTTFLANTTNSAIFDNAMQNDLETAGNARISTAVKKYGTGSIAFDGVSGTYLATANQSTFAFGTGNFTIEGWINAPAAGYDPMTLIRSWNYDGTNFVGFRLEVRAAADGGKLGFYVQTTYILEGTYTANTWVHFAIVKNGTTAVMYINGVATSAPATCNILGPVTGDAYIGIYTPPSGYLFTGYIDDLRITKGIARYTANFTPPTSAHKLK